MARKITIESLIDKLIDKEFFYDSRTNYKARAEVSIYQQIVKGAPYMQKNEVVLEGKTGEIWNDITAYLDRELEPEKFFAKYEQELGFEGRGAAEVILVDYLDYCNNKPKVNSLFTGEDSKTILECVDYNTGYINTLYTWFSAPPENGKRNFFSILSNHTNYSCRHIAFTLFTKKKRSYKGKKYTKAQLFRIAKYMVVFKIKSYILRYTEAQNNIPKIEHDLDVAYLQYNQEPSKEALINLQRLRLKQAIALSDIASLKVYQYLLAQLNTLTYKEISDRHTPVKKKAPKVYTPKAFVNSISHCELFDNVGALKLVSVNRYQKADAGLSAFSPEGAAAPNGDMVKAIYKGANVTGTLICEASDYNNISNNAIFRDKLLLLFRVELNKENVNKQGPRKVTLFTHNVMLAMGYTQEQIEEPKRVYDFLYKVKEALFPLKRMEFTIGKGNNALNILGSYDANTTTIEAEFTEKAVSSMRYKHSWEHSSLKCLEIPDRQAIAYWSLRKLESNYTQHEKVGHHRENKLSMRALYEYLVAKNCVQSPEQIKDGHYKRKIIEPIIKALKYLTDEGFAEVEYFVDEVHDEELNHSLEQLLTDEELELYCIDMPTFLKLRLFYDISGGLKGYVEENRKLLEAKAQRQDEARAKARGKRKRTTGKKKAAAQEVEAVGGAEAPSGLDAFTV